MKLTGGPLFLVPIRDAAADVGEDDHVVERVVGAFQATVVMGPA